MRLDFVVQRFQFAQEYLRALQKMRAISFQGAYVAYRQGQLQLPQIMAMLHPINYTEAIDQVAICGPRAFQREVSIESLDCQSIRIWGYACETRSQIVADHVFPYSLGGATVGGNKIYLCNWHNQVKCNDIHLFPWENGEPPWVSERIDAIQKLLNS